MKILTVLLLLSLALLALPSTAFSQDQKIDSLLKTLQAQQEDTNKVKTYFEIIKIMRHYDYDGALNYASLQLTLSNKLNYAWGKGKACNSIGLIQRFNGNMGISTNNFFRAAEIFLSAKDYNNAVTACSNAADNYTMVNKPDSAIILSRLANSYNKNVTDSALQKENAILFYSNMSGIYYAKKKPDSTIVYSDSAIMLAKEMSDFPRLADEYLQSAIAYQSLKKNEIALEYFRMSLPIYETLQGYSQMIQAHHAMGYSFYALAQYDSSIHHAQIALQLMARVKDSTNLQDNYLNMGLAYAGLKDYNAAINWYKKGIADSAHTSQPKILLQFYQYLGEALFKLQRYKEAITAVTIALSKADTADHKIVYECSNMLSVCYEAVGDNKTALLFARKSETEERLYFDSTQAQIVAEINLKNETQKKEDQIKLLSAQNQLSATLAEAENQQKKLALAGICLLVIAGFYSFYRYKKKRKLQSQQAIANERLRISRELHDEVGSTLSGIAMYSHLSKEQMKSAQMENVEKSLNIMQQSASEMVAKLNDIVWLLNPAQESLEKLVQKLEDYANDMCRAKDIHLNVKVNANLSEVKLSMATRHNIYLFCKEAINNAVKHSECSSLELLVREINDTLELSIADNGKGFNEATIQKGNGLANMKKRGQEIGAAVGLETEYRMGSRLFLRVKT
ncbi:MAG: histidine kinase [Chitinophagaceae bacterium]